MCIRKLLPLTVCIILHLYHQDLSANAIVAERSMTYCKYRQNDAGVTIKKKKNNTIKRKEAQIDIYPSVW